MLSFNWSDQFNVSWPVLQVSLTNQNKTELQFTQCTFWWITADCSPPNIYRNRHILTWFHRIQIKWAEHSALNVLVLFHTAKRVFVVVRGDEFTSVAHLCSLRSCRWSHSRPTLNRHQTVRLFNWCKKVFTGPVYDTAGFPQLTSHGSSSSWAWDVSGHLQYATWKYMNVKASGFYFEDVACFSKLNILKETHAHS